RYNVNGVGKVLKKIN
nr:glia-derived nexin, GDN, protease nexin-1 [rats, brain, Peptide Recombinant Partial, 15 aa] [Rattus sp.]